MKLFSNLFDSFSTKSPKVVETSFKHSLNIYYLINGETHLYSRSHQCCTIADSKSEIERINADIDDIYNQLQNHTSAFIHVSSGFLLRKTDFISSERLYSQE